MSNLSQLRSIALLSGFLSAAGCSEEMRTERASVIIKNISNACVAIIADGKPDDAKVATSEKKEGVDSGEYTYSIEGGSCTCQQSGHSIGCSVSTEEGTLSFSALPDNSFKSVIIGFQEKGFGFAHKQDGNCYRVSVDLETKSIRLEESELLSEGRKESPEFDCSVLANFAGERADNTLWFMEHPPKPAENIPTKKRTVWGNYPHNE